MSSSEHERLEARLEERLEESEARFRSLAEAASDAIITIDEDSTILFVNSATETIFGHPIQEMLGRNLAMLMPEYLLHLHSEAAKHYLHTGRRHLSWEAIELPGLHRSGREIPLEVSFAEAISKGKHYFTGIIRDISGRKRIEKERFQLADYVQLLLESTGEGIYGIDTHGRCTFINKAAARMLGYEREELLGKNMHALVHHSHADGSPYPEGDCPIFRAFLTGHGVSVDNEVLWRKDGVAFFAEYASYPLIEEGVRKGAVVTFSDITERKQTEEALHEANHRALRRYEELLARLGRLAQTVGTADAPTVVFRALLDFVRDSAPCNGIFVSLYDPERQERHCVYAWCEGEEEDVSMLPPLPMSDSPNSRAVKTGQVVVVDDFQAAISGQPRLDVGFDRDPNKPQSSVCVPMVVSGHVIGAFEVQSTLPAAYKQEHVTALEVAANFAAIATENVRLLGRERELRRAAQELNETLEERVRQRTSELEEAYSELETFTYTVSHDLRSPLNSISGFSEALREDYEAQLDDTAQYYLSRIHGNAKRMTQLIDDILELSRVSRKPLRLEKTDLCAVAREVIEDLRHEQPQRQVQFRCVGVGEVVGDAGLLRIALENLLGNAWKFTMNCDAAVFELGVTEVDGEVVHFVRDNGVGFDMMYASKLFAVFERLHSDAEFRGTGIGLATVQRIVHRHGGRIWAEAEPGKGATFFFTLNPTGATSGQGVP